MSAAAGRGHHLRRSPHRDRSDIAPMAREADRRPDGKGGYFITWPHNVLDRLKATRGPGEL